MSFDAVVHSFLIGRNEQSGPLNVIPIHAQIFLFKLRKVCILMFWA